MRPPKDSEDFAAHVVRDNGAIKIYCVECEYWSDVIIVSEATVTYRQNTRWIDSEDARQPKYYCGRRGCWADVGYLLSEVYMRAVLELAEVPILQETKPAPPRAPLAKSPKQLRLL